MFKTPDPKLIQELVDANHILFDQSVVDGFGHVSVRHPSSSGHFLISRSLAPALVTPADIMTFDLDSKPVDAAGRTPYLETFIHGEIYRLRPDVNSVVHSHSPSVVPFSVVPSRALRPICHMCGFLDQSTPIFDIREAAGDGTDLLIRNPSLGAALAKSLGKGPAVLMRGHGSTVVGRDIQQAVFRAVYTEVNARLQSEASRLGEPIFLTAAEAAAAAEMNDGVIGRAWGLWKMRAQRNQLSILSGAERSEARPHS